MIVGDARKVSDVENTIQNLLANWEEAQIIFEVKEGFANQVNKKVSELVSDLEVYVDCYNTVTQTFVTIGSSAKVGDNTT